MRAPIAWVLNLDAEEELAAGRRYQVTDRLRAIVRRERARLVGSLVQPGDLIVDETTVSGAAAGFEGRAWSPTPSALRLLEHAGAVTGPTPATTTLARVNARPFAVAVRATLENVERPKRVASDLERALELLRAPASLGWLVRRTFGAAGRGRRRIASGAPTEVELAWLAAGLARGPLVVEPWVAVTTEFTRSGFVTVDGDVRVAAPCLQQTTREGAWSETSRAGAGDVRAADDVALETATARAGEALAAAGYHGPYGVDAFLHREGACERLEPLSEINARYTMDWRTDWRPGWELES